MNDADAFLDNIVLNPECRTTRLVYADWLDEQTVLEKKCDPKAVHRHYGAKGDTVHERVHDTKPFEYHHHCDEKCLGPSWHAEVASFWRAQVHFPYEVKTTLDHFFAVAPFLALFPQLEWVEFTDFNRLGEKDYRERMKIVWTNRLINNFLNVAMRGGGTDETHSLLSVSCLEYVWGLRPRCYQDSHGHRDEPQWMASHPSHCDRVFLCHGCRRPILIRNIPLERWTIIPMPRKA